MSSKHDVEFRPDAGRLARRLARSMVVGWTIGVAALTALSITLAALNGLSDLDGRLSAHATAAYGLAWFDQQGALHTRTLERELDVLDDDIHIAIVVDGRVAWGTALDDAGQLGAETTALGEGIRRTIDGRRVFTTPIYGEVDDTIGGAAVVWSETGAVVRSTLIFAAIVGVAALLFIGLGLTLGRRLSARILSALLDNVATREEVLAGAAHELKTPLATVLALAETTPRDEAAEALDDVAAVTRRAAAMVRRLLIWSQLATDRPELQPIRLDLLVETHLTDSEAFTGEEVIVRGDPRLIDVAMRNLIENARTHGRGIARVRVVGGRVEVHDQRAEGFDPTVLEPFVKGEASAGHGLGLALVARIAAVHQATLEPGPPVALVFSSVEVEPPQG